MRNLRRSRGAGPSSLLFVERPGHFPVIKLVLPYLLGALLALLGLGGGRGVLGARRATLALFRLGSRRAVLRAVVLLGGLLGRLLRRLGLRLLLRLLVLDERLVACVEMD